tara:strand:+ start:1204 stop:1389 length:186 start_codon:yes stop_codon:yes gene_type:complete
MNFNHNYSYNKPNQDHDEADGQASKTAWSPEEDVILIQLVERIGAQKWTMISEYLPLRVGK